MPSREQLVEQLRKLRTLAQRAAGTPEGLAARRKLRDLMQLHGISVEDLKPPAAPKSSQVRTSTQSPASTPVKITVKLGDLRIRWKL